MKNGINDNSNNVSPYVLINNINQSNGLGIASMVLGILAIVFLFLFPLMTIPLSIIGVILGACGLGKNPKGTAIAGFVMSLLPIVMSLIIIAFGISLCGTGSICAIGALSEASKQISQEEAKRKQETVVEKKTLSFEELSKRAKIGMSIDEFRNVIKDTNITLEKQYDGFYLISINTLDKDKPFWVHFSNGKIIRIVPNIVKNNTSNEIRQTTEKKNEINNNIFSRNKKVKEECFASIDEETNDRLTKLCIAKDELGVKQLILYDKVFVIEENTEVLIVDAGFLTHGIRVLNGKLKGKYLIISAEFIN